MIGRIQGTLVYKKPPYLMVDVHGIAYEIEVPMLTFYTLPDTGLEVTLLTHLVIREDAHLLFGFSSIEERALFRNLIKVNGVGAKMALAILSGMTADDFSQHIRNGNIDSLTKLPGVGKKTAERLIIEMTDRLPEQSSSDRNHKPPTDYTDQNTATADAISALIALGYKPQEASRFVHAVATDNMGSEEIIRQALRASVKK